MINAVGFIMRTFLVFFLMAAAAAQPCAFFCRFRLCDPVTKKKLPPGPKLLLRSPRRSISPFVCVPKRLGRVRSTGEAQVLGTFPRFTKPRPISGWRPEGLNDPFGKRFFQLYDVPYLTGGQGVGRLKTTGNQRKFLNGRCFVMPIETFDILNSDGSVAETKRVKGRNGCFTFRLAVPVVLVELIWDSSDDLDLIITEPDGKELSIFNSATEAGRLDTSGSADVCGESGTNVFRKEDAIYDEEKKELVQNGRYRVKVVHFTNCGGGATKWELRVRVNDQFRLQRKGVSNQKSGTMLTTASFDVEL